MKVTHRGLAPPDDPIYKRGWTLYVGPQPKKPAETPSKNPPEEPSEDAGAENQAAEKGRE